MLNVSVYRKNISIFDIKYIRFATIHRLFTKLYTASDVAYVDVIADNALYGARIFT